MKVIYKGLFMDCRSEDILVRAEDTKQLEVNAKDKHITFQLHPKEYFPEELLHQDFRIRVTGYGNDGRNSGFEVELPEILLPYYKGAEKVHITTSLASDASAKDTKKLDFEAIEPFYVFARLGYFIGKDVLFQTPKED